MPPYRPFFAVVQSSLVVKPGISIRKIVPFSKSKLGRNNRFISRGSQNSVLSSVTSIDPSNKYLKGCRVGILLGCPVGSPLGCPEGWLVGWLDG